MTDVMPRMKSRMPVQRLEGEAAPKKSRKDSTIVPKVKHIDSVFPLSTVPEIDGVAERLTVLTRGELMRRAWRILRWFIQATNENSTIIIFDGPPPQEQLPGETTRVSARAIL